MTTIAQPSTTAGAQRELPARLVCGGAAALAIVPFVFGSFAGDSGSEITADLVADAGSLQLAGIVAVLAAAGLVLAAVRLGHAIGGVAGRTAAAAGVAVAVLFAAYYATFAAGAVVATQSLSDPGAGLGESTALLLNLVEITRYAPGFALVAAVVVARRALPKPVWISALVLAVMTLVPFTSWVAALLIPLWMAVSAAGLRHGEE